MLYQNRIRARKATERTLQDCHARRSNSTLYAWLRSTHAFSVFHGEVLYLAIDRPSHRYNLFMTQETRHCPNYLLQCETDGFGLRIEVQNFVPHFPPPSRLLVPPEGECSIKDVIAIDPYGASFQARCEPVCLADVSGPYRSSETVDGVVCSRDDLVRIGERGGCKHRSEDFFPDHSHFRTCVDEYRWPHKIALSFQLFPSRERSRPFGKT